MKKLKCFILLIVLIFGTVSTTVFAEQKQDIPSIYYDDKKLELNNVFLSDGEVFVSFRELFQAMGFYVIWDSDKKMSCAVAKNEDSFYYQDTSVGIKLNELNRVVMQHGKLISYSYIFDTPAQLIDGNLFIPISALESSDDDKNRNTFHIEYNIENSDIKIKNLQNFTTKDYFKKAEEAKDSVIGAYLTLSLEPEYLTFVDLEKYIKSHIDNNFDINSFSPIIRISNYSGSMPISGTIYLKSKTGTIDYKISIDSRFVTDIIQLDVTENLKKQINLKEADKNKLKEAALEFIKLEDNETILEQKVELKGTLKPYYEVLTQTTLNNEFTFRYYFID